MLPSRPKNGIEDAQSPRLGWPSIMGGDAGDPGGPAALCKLGMEWVCQVGGND